MEEKCTVARLRKAKRISQFKLSQLAGVSRYRISLHECGYSALEPAELERIANVLGITPASYSEIAK